METSLHRELKQRYALPGAQLEVKLGNYRIDVVNGRQLVEVQHGSLAAIRRKLQALLPEHPILLVKPVIARKMLIKQKRAGGKVVSRRMSPKQQSMIDAFDELIYLTRVFPHPNLAIELVLVELEEWRYPGHGRRRRWRTSDYIVADQKLVAITNVHRLQSIWDLQNLLPETLPKNFHSADLAELLNVRRPVAQRIAYCLRQTGAAQQVGKLGNTRLYELTPMDIEVRAPKTAAKMLGPRKLRRRAA